MLPMKKKMKNYTNESERIARLMEGLSPLKKGDDMEEEGESPEEKMMMEKMAKASTGGDQINQSDIGLMDEMEGEDDYEDDMEEEEKKPSLFGKRKGPSLSIMISMGKNKGK